MSNKSERCPTCDSPSPELHPAVQHEGEVEICKDQWHGEDRMSNLRLGCQAIGWLQAVRGTLPDRTIQPQPEVE